MCAWTSARGSAPEGSRRGDPSGKEAGRGREAAAGPSAGVLGSLFLASSLCGFLLRGLAKAARQDDQSEQDGAQ